jgi:hypothetical protein
MRRKDYVLLSAALKEAREGSTHAMELGHNLDAHYIANALAADNPAFDKARFLRDAGVPS